MLKLIRINDFHILAVHFCDIILVKETIMRKIAFGIIVLLSALVCLPAKAQIQDNVTTQTIRGTVIDKDSKFPIIGANVVVMRTDSVIGTKTDENGYFTLPGVPLGRASIKISYLGYKDGYANDILMIAGKESQLNIELEEKVNELKEIQVTDKVEKGQAKNEFATVSARSFDVEQTSRFSGSRNDPARMASNFAGVSGANDARNDIIIRGNSPTGLLWRLDGVDIPSPNHFASFGSSGGPVSMLNNNTLARSDFFTAAFPAEYGDAISGVFDLKMRNGNRDKYEFLGQVGFNGIELGAEGPFAKKESKASFLINYRYSTLGLFKLIGANFGTGTATPEYQDLSFKINVPTNKAGTFSLFGLGGLSSINLLGSALDLKNTNTLYGNENQNIYNRVQTGIVGFSHTYFITPRSFFRTTIAASHQTQKADIDTINISDRSIITNYEKSVLRQNKYSVHLMYSNKLDSKNTIIAGLISNVYDVKFGDSLSLFSRYYPLISGKGYSDLLEGYTEWQHKFGDRVVLNAGAHLQYYTLSKSFAAEPRLGAKYSINEHQSISVGYGLHDGLQPLPTYYSYDTSHASNGKPTNLNMGFTRSNHFVLGYDVMFKNSFHIKTEVYFQYIDKVPVEQQSSSFSMLNAGSAFSTPTNTFLVNKGVGRNYGLELTLEKFFTKGYYFLVTGSLFDAKYKGSDDVWRNTAFNGRYVANALGGYEYKFGGKKRGVKRNVIAIDGKVTVAGGRYYTPVDLVQSHLQGHEVDVNNQAFSLQYPVYFRLDLKISYRFSLKKTTHEFSFDVQNVTNQHNVFIKLYDVRTNSLVTEYQQGFFPLPQYRILF
jgi:hypothetical protein